MKTKLSLIAFLTLIFNLPIWAARWSPPREDKPSYKFGIVATNIGTTIKDPLDPKATTIQYVPNSLGRVFFGVEYLGYGLSLGTTSKATAQDIEERGYTSGLDYQFRFFREKHTFDLFYQKYQGFYINNSSEVDPSIGFSKIKIQRSDFHTEHSGFQYFQTLNPEDFSLPATFDQSGWQTESGGSWLVYSAYHFHHLDAESSLIPSSLSSLYSSIDSFKGGNFRTLKLGAGGAYNFVFKGFYLAGLIIFAGGQQEQKYDLAGSSVARWIPAEGYNLKLSLGYNGEKYFTGIHYFGDSTVLSLEGKKIEMTTTDTKITFGIHL